MARARPADAASASGPLQKPTLRVEEAADLLGISRRSAYRACARGDIPSIRIGRRLVVPASRLAKLIEGDSRGKKQ